MTKDTIGVKAYRDQLLEFIKDLNLTDNQRMILHSHINAYAWSHACDQIENNFKPKLMACFALAIDKIEY